MDAKGAVYKVTDIVETALLALERVNSTEDACVVGVLKETRRYTDALLDALEKNGLEEMEVSA